MIPIKFRAWDKEDTQMRDVLAVNFYHRVLSVEYEGDQFVQDGMNRFILMQYTGLKDKDGVEIYEGDVITEEIGEGEYLFAEVTYKDGCFLGKEQNFKPEYPISDFVKGKVIGNVYQNPELIKNET